MFRPWEDEQPHCKRELQAELSVSLPVTHEHVAHYNGPLDDGAGAVQRDSLPQILTPQLGSLHDGGRSDTGSPDYSSAAASARADTAEPALGHGMLWARESRIGAAAVHLHRFVRARRRGVLYHATIANSSSIPPGVGLVRKHAAKDAKTGDDANRVIVQLTLTSATPTIICIEQGHTRGH